MNLEDNLDDEQINYFFRYWSHKEMKLYYGLMLEHIDDEKCATKDNMWHKSIYKLFFEEFHNMLRQPRRIEGLHQQI